MKVAGFTFIRNAVQYDYPIVESIRSILPLVDEMVVALGKSEDSTEELIRSIGSAKIKIVPTIWDESLRDGGRVLAAETDKALAAISSNCDWAFYIQGDEVVHEKYLPLIQREMERYKNCSSVEGLLFHYLHFYGSYGYVGTSRNWYRKEIRIIRPHIGIESYKDAQGFRLQNRKLRVAQIDAYIYHYGWVKPPSVQQQKISSFNRWWHSDEWIRKNIPSLEKYDYSCIDMLQTFKDSHPTVMNERISKMNWNFTHTPSFSKPHGWKNRLLFFIEKATGYRIAEYKNYQILRHLTSKQ